MPIRVLTRVGELAGNKPDGATAFQLPGSTLLPGCRGFAAEGASGDSVFYAAVERDADGNETGSAYEYGLLTLASGSPWTGTRTVIESSNSDAAVDWSGATGDVLVYAVAPDEVMFAPVHRNSASAGGTGSFDFEGLLPGFSYLLELERINGTANSTTLTAWLRMKREGQPAYDDGATDYEYQGQGMGAGSYGSLTSSGAAQIALTNGTIYGTGSGFGDSTAYVSGHVWIHVPQDAMRTKVTWNVGYGNAGGPSSIWHGHGYRDSDAAVAGVQLLFSSGDIVGEAVLRRLPRVR